jgi:hypothetical protein
VVTTFPGAAEVSELPALATVETVEAPDVLTGDTDA